MYNQVETTCKTMLSGVAKAKIKSPKNEWQKFLVGKVLFVGEFDGHYSLLGFHGVEGEYRELCRIAWENEPDEEHQYDCLEDFINEVLEGEDGFGFDADEIEITARLDDCYEQV